MANSLFSGGLAGGLFGNNPYSAKEPKVEFYQDKTKPNKQWRWRLFFSSDEVAATSEGYHSEAAAKENFLKIEQHIKFLRERNRI